MQFNADGTIRPRPPAKTNAERQRDFRERNPDYYRLLQAKRRAVVKALVGARREAERAKTAVGIVEMIFRKPPLMLPAPVEKLEIPGITTAPERDEALEMEFAELVRRHRKAA